MKYYILILLSFSLSSCLNVDCEKSAESQKQTECYIIAEKIPDPKSKHRFKIIGFNPNTKSKVIYSEENRWFCEFYKFIDKGDTIVKKKSELNFNIHKKDTVLSFNWECEGKFYK